MKRYLLAGLILMVLGCLSFVWHDGVIKAKSQPTVSPNEALVIVREVPVGGGWLDRVFKTGSVQYRCEYYPFLGASLFSCQTVKGESYQARKFTIHWIASDEVEVEFDDAIRLRCKGGIWMR